MKCFYPVQVGNDIRPCGQCQACMINKQLQWKFRLNFEVLDSDLALWATLQYDELHLPRSNCIPCVSKKHCQNFFRKLRKTIEEKNLKVSFKYFLTSEYGPKTHRPHYHVLLLFKLPQMEIKQMLDLRQILYEEVKERWYHGHCELKLFHMGVTKYLTKYVFKSNDDYDPPVKPFRLISKGIGESYLTKVNINAAVRNDWKTPNGLLPRYYRDKLLPTGRCSDSPNSVIRRAIFMRTIDKAYSRMQSDLAEFGSIEKYIKEQEYLLRCQKQQVERKQKQKYG